MAWDCFIVIVIFLMFGVRLTIFMFSKFYDKFLTRKFAALGILKIISLIFKTNYRISMWKIHATAEVDFLDNIYDEND